MNTDNKETQEELELKLAQERLAEAKRKKALADEMKLAAARAAILQHQADEERALAEQREAQRIIEQNWIEKRKAEQEAKEAEQRKVAQEKLELEKLLATQEEAKRKREDHEKKIQQLEQEALMFEDAAKQAEVEALHMSTPKDETSPMTILMSAHPMSRFFGVAPVATGSAEPAPSMPVAAPVEIIRRKLVDSETQMVDSAFRAVNMRPTPLQIQNLILCWSPQQICKVIVWLSQFGMEEDFVRTVEATLNDRQVMTEVVGG